MSMWQIDIEYETRVIVAVFIDPAKAKRAESAVIEAMQAHVETGSNAIVPVDVADGVIHFRSGGLKSVSLRMNDPELVARVHVRQQQLSKRAEDLAKTMTGVLQ